MPLHAVACRYMPSHAVAWQEWVPAGEWGTFTLAVVGFGQLSQTGAAWGPEAQELLRAAHAPGPMQMHRMRRLFGSCARGQNCTSLDGEGDEHEEEGRDGEEYTGEYRCVCSLE